MTEKELLSQLNSLKNIKPENSWKENNRNLLLSQISGGEDIEEKNISLLDIFFKKAEWLAQPVGVLLLIVSTVFGSGILSIKASRDTKPGDSLYIAKIISEKTHQAITFDEKEKAKLEIKFAGNRADEIAKVLEQDNSEKKDGRVEKLTNDFKKEISAAKTRLEKMNGGKTENKIEENSASSSQVAEVEDQVFSADSGKTKNGMQIEIIEIKEEVVPAAESPKKALDEAKQLFEQEDYAGTLDKLEEANAIVDKTADGSAEGTNNATSTVEAIVDKAASTSTKTEIKK